MNRTFGRFAAAAAALRLAPAIVVVATAVPRNSRRVTLRGMRRCYTYCERLKRPRAASSGFHRSPIFATRAGTFLTVKSSMRTPCSISFQVTGVDTVASGRGRTE